MIEFLEEIEDMLSKSLDAEETSDVESIDLIYDVLHKIEDKLAELRHATYPLQK